MRRAFVVFLAAILTLPLAPLDAQGRGEGGRRDTLEQALRQRFERRIQQVLGASDEQMRRLLPINRRFEGERRAMVVRERGVRGELRQALGAATPDEARVGRLLDTLLSLQQARLELVEREQRELAAVLTPSQRARYLVLQEEIRRRLEGMREERRGRGRGRP
ncbi:MAG TPA: Spy/CpxP family protein refolding chaperone [Gemmatimonadaceae bacterium]